MEERKKSENSKHLIIEKLYNLATDAIKRYIATLDEDLQIEKINENLYRMNYQDEQIEFGFCYHGEENEQVRNFFQTTARKFTEKYIDISPFLKEGSYHVKGYVNSWIKDEKVLTNWIEREENGQCYVFDILKNLVMKKEEYYRIFAPEVIEIYKKEGIINEAKTI